MAVFGKLNRLPGLMGGYGGGTFDMDGAPVDNRFPVGQGMQQRGPEPFVFGEGGRRMSPEDIAILRELSQGQMAAGADFSPVGSIWEGLGRVGQGIMGGLGERDARRAAEANAAESNDVLQALLSGETAADGGIDPVMAALANPNISDQVRGLAELEYKRRNPAAPKPTEFERMLANAGITPGTAEYIQANRNAAMAKSDPLITATLPGERFYSGPQSQLAQFLQGGGDLASGVGAPAPTAPVGRLTPIEGGPASAPGNFPQ